MEQPDHTRLPKAFYGLEQAPRAWHDKIIEYLDTIGFQMPNINPTSNIGALWSLPYR